MSQQYPYVLKADIARFFPSVDHRILLEQLSCRLKNQPLMSLLERIVEHPYPRQSRTIHYFPGDDLFTASERTYGIPIGNQTSQFFGNVVLNPLDHFVKRTLRARGYLRYMDDFVLFGESLAQVKEYRNRIAAFLQIRRLRLHPRKTNIMPVKSSFRFLGFSVSPGGLRIPKPAVHRFSKPNEAA